MASVPRFQFSFGDFSEEEHNNYLNPDHSCVEFPLPWWSKEGDGSTKAKFENIEFLTENSCQPCSNGPTFKDENQNHVPMPNQQQKTCLDNNIKLPTTTSENNKDVPPQNVIKETPNSEANGLAQKTSIKQNAVPSPAKETEMQNLVAAVSETGSQSNTGLVNGHVTDSEHHGADHPLLNGKSDTEINAETQNGDFAQKDGADSTSKLPNSVSSPPPAKQIASWASLFSGTSQNQKQTKSTSFTTSPKSSQQAQTAAKDFAQQKKKQPVVQNGILSKQPSKTEVVEVAKDPFSKQIAEQIAKNEIVYRTPGLMPRGYMNSSNWCYVNATLQALLTSSPFCHLMRSLPSRQPCADTNVISTSTPIMDSFVRLVKELKPLPKKAFQRNSKEQIHGTPYEPDYIYKMLSTIESKFSERGRQQDAEEFLSCVLNGLHEEMLRLTEFYFGKNHSAINHDDSVMKNSQIELGYEVPVHDDEAAEDSNEDEDQWEEVTATRKNRSSVMRRADISKTPVSDVFRGELRSDLFQEGQRGTATLEPFFTLPLDINEQKRWSVAEALEHLTRLETVQDFTNSKTKAKVEATRKLTLETLPPVLILHLKRFIYDKKGGSLKIDKEVQYHTDLLIGKELLSKSSKKISQDKRTYKLFAVVYHHGKASTGGHYTTDVYHDGLNCWLRIDDQHIKTTNVHEVVRHNPERTAYLLYYKRTDLMAV